MAEEVAATAVEEGTVEFSNNAGGGDNVEIKSPAKNRYKGTPLNQSRARSNSKVPVLFERATSVFYNPRFDSQTLEQQHIRNYLHMTQKNFQYALLYIIVACIAWILFFGLMQQENWVAFLAGTVVLLVINVAVLGFSFTQVYQKLYIVTSIIVSLVLCGFLLLSFIYVESEVSAVGTFTGTIEVLVLMYTIIPLPLYLCVIIGVIHSIVFEVISAVIGSMAEPHYIVGRILMHACIHLIGIHIFIMTQARKRSTFLKIGESLVSRQTLDHEKTMKRQMIYSLMPAQVAEEVMKSKEDADIEEDARQEVASPSSGPGGNPGGNKLKFRSFHMSQMDSVSILFADIVGFTKMSSNKTAEHLVSLLNDLFGRFDILCEASGCEKISTLGDCYYCVAGCPEPRADHAQCAIEMGLGMVNTINEFDEDHNEAVNMRVGVHTGTVLCGLVGTRRFKFDVWSNDVNLANTMESEGMPGRVHISDSTYGFVKEDYEVEKGKEVEDIRKIKVLIEDYNTETQQYQIRHVQEQDTIKTFFVVKRIGKSAGLQTPRAPRVGQKANPAGDHAAPANPDAVKINVEDVDKDKKDEEEDAEEDKIQTNHIESQSDVNGSLQVAKNQPSGEESSFIGDEGRDESQNDTALLNQLTSATMDDKKADHRMVSCFQDSKLVEEYLHPPINKCTLNFTSGSSETDFRDHYMEDKLQGQTTFASPRINAFLDMVVSFIFLILVSVCCFLGFPISIPWIVFFVLAFIIETFMLILLLVDVCCGAGKASIGRLSKVISSWIPRHVIGAVLASLPVIGAYSNFSCSLFDSNPGSDLFYCVLVVVSLLHFCNFTMLSSYMKSTLATIAGAILLILLGIGVCKDRSTSSLNGTVTYTPSALDTVTVTGMPALEVDAIFHGDHALRFEIILNMALLLLLIWFLNREFEVSYRLSYHGNMQAAVDARRIKSEKEQADWLLHNIIPEHVADVLKKTSKYCKNHQDVGVIFAKVVNFDEFYDESFEGGREYLRVLNELIGDMEDLFDDPRFKDVEKIKTIGSCLMAASGLNPATRNQNKDPKAHLCALMEFSVELLGKLDQFNLEIFNFDFDMSIGFNFGPITSGVIGSTKLLYDIWGDTVNVSSRMYSTGVSGRIQVTGEVAEALEDKFEFEYRGEVFVKGKGDLKTYLLVKKKEGATWE